MLTPHQQKTPEPPSPPIGLSLIAVGVVALGVVIGGYWLYSSGKEPGTSLAGPPHTISLATAEGGPPTEGRLPAALPSTETLHADIYFGFDQSRLDDPAKAVLQQHAESLKNQTDWSLLVQGYTDPQGPSEYNKALGLRRAQAVKQYLVTQGLPESAIKVVTLGKDGTVCEDRSREDCLQRNRRVHLEVSKGVRPVAPPAPAEQPADEDAATVSPSSPVEGS